MANFEPIQFAPLGIKRDSTALGSKLTSGERLEIYRMFKGELTEPKSTLGKVLVGVNNNDAYIVDLNHRTQTSMVACWLGGAQQELVSATALLSGVSPQNDSEAMEVLGRELANADLPDMAISELMSRIANETPRPVSATVHLYESSYDSVTINQWSIGLASAFFDLLPQNG